jgi:hypothetical protein
MVALPVQQAGERLTRPCSNSLDRTIRAPHGRAWPASAVDVFAVEVQSRYWVRGAEDYCAAVAEDDHIVILGVEFEQIGFLLELEQASEGLAQQIEIHVEGRRQHDLNRVASTERCRRQAGGVLEKVKLVLSAHAAVGGRRHGEGEKSFCQIST